MTTIDDVRSAVVVAEKLARQCANDLDEAFAKNSDPRALQGGAVSDEAQSMRGISNKLTELVSDIDQL